MYDKKVVEYVKISSVFSKVLFLEMSTFIVKYVVNIVIPLIIIITLLWTACRVVSVTINI